MDHATQLLGAWIESARDYAIILVDPDGNVSSWNVGAERILGFNEDEILGQPLDVFFTDEDRDLGVPGREVQRARSNGRASDDRWHVRKDGSRFWCSGVLMRVGDDPNAPDGFVKVMRDLTERKMMEERLRARTEELLSADRRRNEFLAMLSHELRNPLAPIVTSAFLLRQALSGADPVVREARDMIDRQAHHLKRLVDGLLDVSRLSLNRIELQPATVTLGEIVNQAIESVQTMVEERRHTIVLKTDPKPIVMTGDPLRLEQAIAALLSNAALFTEQGGRIEVSVGRHEGQAVVRVRDNGAGMSPAMIERAFDLFAQGEQGLARTTGGLGIGLTLARSLARLHGGTLEGRSEGPGQGSEFILRIPIVPAREDGKPVRRAEETTMPPVSSSKGQHANASPGMRILLVDDNHDAARSTDLVLSQAGHDVLLAYDGAQAIETALRMRPDLVILDVGLPHIDGYSVARELRQRSPIPIVALTGYPSEKMSSLLFDAYLVKPVQPDQLFQTLANLGTQGPRSRTTEGG